MAIGIISGTGLYDIIKKPEIIDIKTKYGKSSGIFQGKIQGKEIFFIPRHGMDHGIPPHLINHRANIYSLKKLGVNLVISVGSVGIINTKIRIEDFVVPHDFIDFSKNQVTFFEGCKVKHVDMNEPFSIKVRESIIKACRKLKFRVHERGIYVNTTGPRLETPAEIRMFRKLCADVVGMTCVPEAVLSKEIDLEYGLLTVPVNYAAGISKEEINLEKARNRMKEKQEDVRKILESSIKLLKE